MSEEHFGIAVGEMVCAGCVVFVPNGGGQREVIGNQPALLYDSPADAVEKIAAVLADDDARRRCLDSLAGRAEALSVERFSGRVREIARDFLAAAPRQ
jgi:glycosyltransferase involved in cell wall biosynthesis